jgi:hypothetical protein
MHAGQVFADDAESEHLRSGKDGYYRSEEWEAGHAAPFCYVAANDIEQNEKAEAREGESDQAGKLLWKRAEAGHHVQSVGYELAQGVV